MKRLIEHILAEEYSQASAELDARMRDIMSRKLVEMKKAIVAETYIEDLDEAVTMRITALETKVLKVLYTSAASNGHDFGFIEDGRKAVTNPRELAGIVTNLIKKKIIEVWEPITVNMLSGRGGDTYTQFTWGKLGQEGVESLLGIKEETIDEAKRFSIVRVRIRKGKVQRRRKVSNIKGYTFRKKGSGAAKLIRMTPMERRKRRLGAKRGKIKRRGKKARIQQKMRIVRRKRAALGLGYKNKKY